MEDGRERMGEAGWGRTRIEVEAEGGWEEILTSTDTFFHRHHHQQ